MRIEDHPTVKRLGLLARPETETGRATELHVDAASLRQLAFECGADDAGLVGITRPGLDPQREEILRNYPWTKTLLSFVVRMAREPVRGPPRSVANLEFHRAGSTILDAADQAGVSIDNACRSGTCGSCRVMRMAVEDALSGGEKRDGYILACQAEITGDVVIDA